MKIILQISFLFLLISQLAYPQWTNQNPVPDGNELWSTYFVDDSTGWIVGSGGFIKKTTNAGLDWIQQNSGTTLILKSIHFVNLNTGWICGESGLILNTTDRGENWFSLTSGTNQHLTDIHFYDSDTGYVAGFGGTILKTTNGGSSWTSLSSGTTNDLYSMDFVDAFIGYAVGGAVPTQTILKTTDGGASWIDKSGGFQFYRYLRSVKFIDANTGFVGGGVQYSHFISKTTDGGETWVLTESILPLQKKERKYTEQLNPYYSVGVNSIYFKDSTTGYAAEGDSYSYHRGIYITTDGGTTWEVKYNGEEEGVLNSIYVTNSGMGCAVGKGGVIFNSEDDGNSWAQILSGNISVCGSGDDLYSIFCINENIGWIVGYRQSCLTDRSIILKTTNGGKIWRTQLHGADETLNSVHFINEYFGWAVTNGRCYRTTDGGENWISNVGGIGSFVFFINQDIGWVTSNYGINKSTDGGVTWAQKSSTRSSSVYFLDISNGWATSVDGILKSTDGGETWINKLSSSGSYIKFYDSNFGMCVGGASVLVSTDGGESWISKIGPSLQTINFINPMVVWGYTLEGTLYKATNFGDTWETLNTGLGFGEKAFFVNEYTGWVCGLGGTMFKYSVEPPPPPIWSNQILVKDAGGTESSGILTFGQHINATDGIDASLGEYELPPSPPTGIFDARFNLPTNPQVSSFIDYRDSIETEIIWTMTFQPGPAGYPITFSWDSTSFPEGTFYLKDRINGSFVNVNMKFKSSYILTNLALTSLNIIFDREGINPTTPSAPTNLTAIADNYSVTLNWADNSDNETGFVIERKDGDSTSANAFMKIDTVATDETAFTNTELTPNTTYTYRVFAFNDFYISGYSNLAQITTPALPATFQLTVSLLAGWNIVSIPGLHPVNQNVTTWWSGKDPSASVFKYNNGYQIITTAELRTGYWMKNLGNQTYSTGDEWPSSGILVVPHDAINGYTGWNLIGGYEYNAAVSGITTTPPGLQDSPVYGYSGGYQMVDYLIPGYGYWIKLSGNGLINLPSQAFKGSAKIAEYIKEDWGKIIIIDAEGRSYTLYAVKGDSPNGGAGVDLNKYEIPPAPPVGMFDIRFSSGRIAEDINSAMQTIEMSGVTYPLTVRVDNMDIRLMDETGKTVNVNLKNGEEVVIRDATISKLRVTGELLPTIYSLEQNYPNPFNPSTVIEFSLPENVGNVKLSIYNTLGEKVAELVNTGLVAGKYSYQWNARNVATGMYIYELRTDKFVSVKKMILLK